MALHKCPGCKLPMTDKEALAGACPACAAPLVDPASPPIKPAETDPPPAEVRTGVYRLLLAAAAVAVVVLGGMRLADSAQMKRDAAVIAHLREGTEAAEARLLATRAQAEKARAESESVAQKLSEANRSASVAQSRIKDLEQVIAASNARVKVLEREQLEAQAQLKALQAPKDVPRTAEKSRPDARVAKEAFAGQFKVITIDRPDGEYRLQSLHNGARVKLVGKVKTLRLEATNGATLDASELMAGEVRAVGFNNKSKVKINAPGGTVTVPFIDNASEVQITAGQGKVAIGWAHGGAQVKVVARECTLDHLDGRDTTLTATLTAAGRLQFREIRGQSHLLWNQALKDDPDAVVKVGSVKAPAVFRRLTPGS